MPYVVIISVLLDKPKSINSEESTEEAVENSIKEGRRPAVDYTIAFLF